MTPLPNLRAELARRGIKRKAIAETLGIKQSLVTDRLNKPDGFKFSECVKIKNKFFPDMTLEYLFKATDEE